MAVSLRAFGGSAAIPTIYASAEARDEAPDAHRARVGIVVANREVVGAIFGDDVATTLMELVQDRAMAFLRAGGSVARHGVDRLDLILRDEAGFGTWGATGFVEAAFRAIASRPVSCGGVDILPELTAIIEGEDTAFQRAAPAGGVIAAGYAGAMASAAKLAEAMSEFALFVAWQPVVSAGSTRELLHYRAIPHLPDTAGASIEPVGMMRAFQRTNMSELFDSHVMRLTIEQLRKQPTLRLACTISAASAVISAWWESIFTVLQSEPEIAARLIVAVDQTVPFPSIAEAVIFADRIRRLGCHFALDNFGAGQTAVGHLPMLAPDIVIIDGVFLHHPSGGGALDHLVGLARNFSPIVLVKGVESEDQACMAEATGVSGFSGRQAGVPQLALLADASAAADPAASQAAPSKPSPWEARAPAFPPPDIRRLRRGMFVAVGLSALLWWGLIEVVRLLA